MVNKRLDPIIRQGEELDNKYISVDLSIAKLLTSMTFLPDIGLDYEFVVNKKGYTSILVKSLNKDKNTKDLEVVLNNSVMQVLQTYQLTKKIYEIMIEKNLLNGKYYLSEENQILWSALDLANARPFSQRYLEVEMNDHIEDKCLQIDTFRKIVSKMQVGYGLITDKVIAMTLGTLNYFTDNDKNKFQNARIDKPMTFSVCVDELSAINKALSFGLQNGENISSQVASRSGMFDKKSSYLSGYYCSRFRNGNFVSSDQIDVTKCNEMLDACSSKL